MIKYEWQRKTIRALAVLALCLTVACGGLLSSIRAGWAGTKPFVQTLVAQNVITQDKANLVIKDVDDVLEYGSTAKRCVDDIDGGLNDREKKFAKGRCYFTFAQNFRTVLARHNIGGNEQLDRIALIGEGFITALEEYFRSVSGASRSIGDGGDPDKVLERKLEQRRKELKAITG